MGQHDLNWINPIGLCPLPLLANRESASTLWSFPKILNCFQRTVSCNSNVNCWGQNQWKSYSSSKYKFKTHLFHFRFFFFAALKNWSESHSVVSDSLGPHGLYSPWNSPGWNTGVGSLSLLQGIFPTQESNQGLLHCRWILYQLSYQRSSYAEVGKQETLAALGKSINIS